MDISLLEEGADFADSSYFYINKSILMICLGGIILSVIACFLIPKNEGRKHWKWMWIPPLICACLYGGARSVIPEPEDAAAWNGANSPGNIYKDYTNTTKSLLMSGTYEYMLRDVFLAYNPFAQLNHAQVISELDTYFEESEPHLDNEKSNLLKDKNVIVVQLENIDEWMLTQENMPNLFDLREGSIDFVNHYATSFATGKTFNTEFIVNTGLIPQSKGSAPSYIYSRNSYPNSLANNFKNDGYEVNSFHTSLGHIYNRATVHKTFGYAQYHDYEQMGMEDFTMDSQMINGYDLMVEPDKFMDFLITYSGHGPFDPELKACSAHLDEVKEYTTSEDFVFLCGLAQAKETDAFIGELVNSLRDSNLLDSTALVFYTDHYAYSTIDAATELALKGTNDPNLLSNVPFFVYANAITPEKVEKFTGTVDVLPTISNLFGFDIDYRYFIGNDIFSDYDDYVFFQDGAILNKNTYHLSTDTEVDNTLKKQIQAASIRLQRSWDMLEVDYLSTFK